MAEETALQSEHQTRIKAWERSAPWHRRFSMRIGLEGKLILCFMAVLCLSLGTTCLMFIRETHERLGDIMGEQARQVATALSLTSERLARDGDWQGLNARAQELIKSRNILFIGFLDADGTARLLASRDLDFSLLKLKFDSTSLMRVTGRRSPIFGEYSEVVAPILTTIEGADANDPELPGPRLLGYVAVGVSQAREEAQIYRVQFLVLGVACVIIILMAPIAFALIHRIFLPIRTLLTITKRITSGDLDARAEIYRPDVIGDLARHFDEMVVRVKQHQQDLADANDRLAEVNQELEKKVEHRTAELQSANHRLSAEISEKEEFLRAVSHDLNAPLRNIGGMVSLLLSKHKEVFDDDVVYRLQRIKSNVEVETDLIGELLELSRIKTRRLKMERVEAAGVIEELRGIFENDLRSRAIHLIVDTTLPVLHAERSRMRQLFQNLIDNAIKYMGDSSDREIHIGCEIKAGEAEFYVRDTGIGIDPEDIEKVFFVFRRGRNTISQNIAGKGVGLASVKSIVETYGGTIGVSSEQGHGSTFRFTINGKFIMQPETRVAA